MTDATDPSEPDLDAGGSEDSLEPVEIPTPRPENESIPRPESAPRPESTPGTESADWVPTPLPRGSVPPPKGTPDEVDALLAALSEGISPDSDEEWTPDAPHSRGGGSARGSQPPRPHKSAESGASQWDAAEVGPGAEDLQGDADDWYPEAPGHSPGAPSQAPLHLEEVGLQNFDSSAPPRVDPRRVSMLGDVKLPVKIELGKNRMLVEDVLKLEEGSVVELDRLAGDPVAVYVNERLVARGEILILNDNFCVRISDVLTPDPHRIAE